MTRFGHPFMELAAVEAKGELTIVRGDGVYVYDADGKRYFDATAERGARCPGQLEPSRQGTSCRS